jgi:hypothetical protein
MSENLLEALFDIWHSTEKFSNNLITQDLAKKHAITINGVNDEAKRAKKWVNQKENDDDTDNRKSEGVVGYDNKKDFDKYYTTHKDRGHQVFKAFTDELKRYLTEGDESKDIEPITNADFSWICAPTKKQPRAWFKFVCKYNFDATQIKDLERGTITFENAEDL